jgi:hypothetical protein
VEVLLVILLFNYEGGVWDWDLGLKRYGYGLGERDVI